MIVEEQKSPVVTKSRLLNPWWVALAALVFYGLTLNHWVTLRGLPWIAPVAGWDWHPVSSEWRPMYFAPLWTVVTLPFRLLPVAWIPVALNFFAAICAAGSLGLLAASVHLLPQDRTREQRIREHGEYALFSGRWAFVPQLFAALMLGLQVVFWTHATVASNEMLDLLVFAFLVYCLLRFRITQNERWLQAMALVYGLGLSNNFALIGFFPLFLMALVWIKGMSFFNIGFILKEVALGVVGMLLYLVLPIMGSHGPNAPAMGTLLVAELKQQSMMLRLVPGWIALVAALSTLAPLLCASFRWPEIEGELSAIGNALTQVTFMAMNVLFLPVALLVFLDVRMGTNPAMHGAPTAFLPFYYLGALAVGYYAGYILVVFGKTPLQRVKFKASRGVSRLVVALVWLLLVAAPIGALVPTIARIRASNNGVLQRFAAETIAALPASRAVVLSDDPMRLELLEAGYKKAGKTNPNILLETDSLPYKEYFEYLEGRYPELQKRMMPMEKFPARLAEANIVDFIYQLGRQYPIYYLQPSFGYFFERFYLRPHRLVYEMKPYSTASYLPPPPSATEIQDNEAFWKEVQGTSLEHLPKLVTDGNWDAARVAVDYSVALDFWGVDLQQANHLAEARNAFSEAALIDTNNFMAKHNLEYNQHLQRGDHKALAADDSFERAMDLYRSVPRIIKYNGPPDEPTMDLIFGQELAQGGNLRQAAGLFERRLQLLPEDVPAKLAIAKTLVDTGDADRALALTRQIRAATNSPPDDLYWVEAVAYMAHTNFPEAEKRLLEGVGQQPDNLNRLANAMEFYRRIALVDLSQGRHDQGVARMRKALGLVKKMADLISSGKAGGRYGLSDILMVKADVEAGLEMWDAAAQTLTRVLETDPDNVSALLYRTAVFSQEKKYDDAKEDAQTLLRAAPKEKYKAYGAFIEIAKEQNDLPAQIKYMRLYLKSVPEASSQYASMKKALDKAEGR